MKYAIVIAVVLGLVILGTSNSFADTTTPGDPIYMNYDNLNIKGDVTAEGHLNWIELNSFQWGVGRAISSPTSGGAREASAPSVSEITITKVLDRSSPSLLQEALAGEGKPVVIDFVKTGGGTGAPFTYIEYTLDNVLISKYSISSGGDQPTESISLSFTKVQFAFTPQNPDGSPGTPLQVTYDIALARVS